MLRIRLTRRGKKNRPFFRIVVAEASMPIKGRFIEILGFLDPILKKVEINAERVKYWISQGAQPSDTVNNLLIKHQIIKGEKIGKFAKKKRKEGEEETKDQGGQKPAIEETAKPQEGEKKEEKAENTEPIKTEEVKEETKEVEEKVEETKPAEETKEEKQKDDGVQVSRPEPTEEKVEPLPTEEGK